MTSGCIAVFGLQVILFSLGVFFFFHFICQICLFYIIRQILQQMLLLGTERETPVFSVAAGRWATLPPWFCGWDLMVSLTGLAGTEGQCLQQSSRVPSSCHVQQRSDRPWPSYLKIKKSVKWCLKPQKTLKGPHVWLIFCCHRVEILTNFGTEPWTLIFPGAQQML